MIVPLVPTVAVPANELTTSGFVPEFTVVNVILPAVVIVTAPVDVIELIVSVAEVVELSVTPAPTNDVIVPPKLPLIPRYPDPALIVVFLATL